MQFDVITLFPDLLRPFLELGVLGKALGRGALYADVHDLRLWSGNKWGQVDDEPYGGGAGMVLQAPPVVRAVREVVACNDTPARILMMSPRGALLTQERVRQLADEERIILLCGRYEGFDERIGELVGSEELSVGDYVLGGGEVAAMAVIEAVSRLIPGVVGDPESVTADSFWSGLLDYPCYTRPPAVEGLEVPAVLRSGDHEAIRIWRLERSVEATLRLRPDLVRNNWGSMSDEVRELVARLAPDLARQCESDGYLMPQNGKGSDGGSE
ncbi:MAG: tRNA (guanosine(37)-N1)-methyltransferase TrmD [bacterium]|nr:tRNA (guanosine(37)-N1)-methyltransferase TrmD [bacterium]